MELIEIIFAIIGVLLSIIGIYFTWKNIIRSDKKRIDSKFQLSTLIEGMKNEKIFSENITDLFHQETLTEKMLVYLWFAMEYQMSFAIIGDPTTKREEFLKQILIFLPNRFKVITVHENEIYIVQNHRIIDKQLLSKYKSHAKLEEFIQTNNPDYIIMYKKWPNEKMDFICNLGLMGYKIIMFYNVKDLASFITLVDKYIGVKSRITLIKSFDISIQIVSPMSKEFYRIEEINELIGVDADTNEIITNPSYRYNYKQNNFDSSDHTYVLKRIQHLRNMTEDNIIKEFKNREKVIHWIKKSNKRNFVEVSNIILQYHEKQNELMKQINRDLGKK